MSQLNEKSYTVLKCSTCEFIWQKLQPINEFAFKIYEEIIDKNKSFLKSENIFKLRKEKFRTEFDLIFNYFNKEKINVLDFGAGWGSWLKSIDKSRVNLFVFELSETRKKYLIKEGIEAIDYNSVNKYKNFFHFIRLEQVLEHLTDLKYILKLINEISNERSIIHASVPNGKKQINEKEKIKIEKGPIQPLEHVNCFSNKSLMM